MRALQRGFSCIVPLRILQLFTWQQVEVLVAGEPDIDVDYLKEHTEYRGYKPTDDVIKRFWRVLASLRLGFLIWLLFSYKMVEFV